MIVKEEGLVESNELVLSYEYIQTDFVLLGFAVFILSR
jgi:hypothetical protein